MFLAVVYLRNDKTMLTKIELLCSYGTVKIQFTMCSEFNITERFDHIIISFGVAWLTLDETFDTMIGNKNCGNYYKYTEYGERVIRQAGKLVSQ